MMSKYNMSLVVNSKQQKRNVPRAPLNSGEKPRERAGASLAAVMLRLAGEAAAGPGGAFTLGPGGRRLRLAV